MSVIKITAENFEQEVLNSDKPVLIDLWAEWCMPCRMLSPTVDKLAEELDDIKVCKINVDEQRGLAEKFSVMSIPMLVVVKDKTIVNSTVGVQSREQILKLLGK
ncbi:MAG: thioredoxin [Clostridia bacterium]|nr:thioredoxin [Clostridia bacterium]